VRKLTPRKAIREFCVECAGSVYEANNCTDTDPKYQDPCPLHPHRSGKRPRDFRKQLTPMKAIRKHCIQCMGGNFKDVRGCTDFQCNLFFYRFGRFPKRYELGGVFIGGNATFTNRMGNTFKLPSIPARRSKLGTEKGNFRPRSTKTGGDSL